jgi:hypothetical protein
MKLVQKGEYKNVSHQIFVEKLRGWSYVLEDKIFNNEVTDVEVIN